MTNVEAGARDDEGTDYTKEVGAPWPRQPVAVLYPGATLHLKLSRNEYAHKRPGSLVVRWKDGRRGVQEREICLSYQRVT